MMKSFTFNCDDFILNDHGGTFIRGRRKFALLISSSELSIQILKHVKEKNSFTEAEYPPDVISALFREGLLRQSGNLSIWAHLMNWINSFQCRWRQFLERFKLQLERDPVAILVFFNLRPIILWFLNDEPIVLLKKQATNAIVRLWAWSIYPVLIGILATLDTLWLVINHQFSELNTIGVAVHTMDNPFLVIILLMSYLIIHEFAHASSAYNRLGKCGEIRMYRFFYVIPYLTAHLPDIGSCSCIDRLAISASGPVAQISCSILLIMYQPHSVTILYASELSIILALLSLIPIGNTDGYWILVDLLDGKKPKLTISWSIAGSIDIAYTIGLGLLVGVIILVIFR